MKGTSVTFQGSLGELTQTLRDAANEANRWKVIEIFPETGINRSITGELDNLCEYNKSPDRRRELLEQGKVRFIIPFFNKHLLELEKIYSTLYPGIQDSIPEAAACFRKLKSNLREIRRRLKVSRDKENIFCHEDMIKTVNEFNDSFPPAFGPGWKLTAENLGSRPHWLSKQEFSFPLTVSQIDSLIAFATTWANWLNNHRKTGRPPKPFNVLLFHAVNEFTGRYITEKRDYIIKDGKYRTRRNWQLATIALLWLHVLYNIPEMKAFIKAHEKEDACSALKEFVRWAKREYSHFRESGKGYGKFAPAFPDGTEWLGIPLVYLKEDGTLSGRLV